jgi:DNA-binding response OmpR family regulator
LTTNTPADEPLSSLRTATVWMIAAGEAERWMYASLYQLVEARAAALRRFSSLAAVATAVEALANPTPDLSALGPPHLVVCILGAHHVNQAATLRRLRIASGAPWLVVLPADMDLYVPLYVNAGMDDFLVPPTGPEAFLARLHLTMNRHRPPPAVVAPLYDDGYLAFDGYRLEALVQGEPVDLTARELKLLAAFIELRDAALTYDQLANVLWGHDGEHGVADIHTHISHLRRKLEPDPARPRYFLTRRGVGYRFAAQG